MERTILHCDCNSYFASVESVGRPELKSVPMAVCGDPESRHGIILAKNELAKKCGVQTAETIRQALVKCPSLVLVAPHHHKYGEFCRRINAIYAEYTDLVEAFSIDESWLDVTNCPDSPDGPELADVLRRRVRDEIGITISVGVSFNKTFAKMGSDYKKPDATTVITRDNFRDIIWPLPVSDMLFIGRATVAELGRVGIKTIGDLAREDRGRICALLGRAGEAAWGRANGIDDDPVKRIGESAPPKSIGNSITFMHDLKGRDEVRSGLLMLCDQVGARLRRQNMYCSTLQVQIKDPYLKTIQRQKTLPASINTTKEIFSAAFDILCSTWPEGAPIRLLSVTASGLTREALYQFSLLDEAAAKSEKLERLDGAMDKIRAKYGKSAIKYGSTVNTDIVKKRSKN